MSMLTFQPGLKFHFDYMGIFSDFLARLPELKILAQLRPRIFSPGWNVAQAESFSIYNLIFRPSLHDPRLLFTPR